MKLGIFLAILALACAEDLQQRKQVKRSYVCPPNFVRLSHRCYYFSKDKAPWQTAYFHCRDRHSNLAIIKNANQDKLIRRTLSKTNNTEPLERWIGGVFDWAQMAWKWGASGKPVTYNGFAMVENDKEKLQWQCIIVDPQLQYRWSSRSCYEQKHYICHTKLKNVTNKGKKKLQQQYNVDKYNKLNEIPIPDMPYNHRNETNIKNQQSNSLFHLEANNDLNAEFATVPKQQRRRKARRNGKKKKVHQPQSSQRLNNSPDLKQIDNQRRRKNKAKEVNLSMENLQWKMYYKDSYKKNPLYPRPVVEEFDLKFKER